MKPMEAFEAFEETQVPWHVKKWKREGMPRVEFLRRGKLFHEILNHKRHKIF
jgi:hypothetical protein